MLRYYVRLDDAHHKMDLDKWIKIIKLLDKYNIKAIIGVIPDNKDDEINYNYQIDNFWDIIKKWQNNGHIIGLHGLNHLKLTKKAGIIPKNNRSEFAGLSFNEQLNKIKISKQFFKQNDIDTNIFIAPFHSFDINTIKALKQENIHIIYDGISLYPYREYEVLFVPQQYNFFKKRKKGIWSVCLHPSEMKEEEIFALEKFIKENKEYFKNDFFEVIEKFNRKKSIEDMIFFYKYFLRRKLFLLKKKIKGSQMIKIEFNSFRKEIWFSDKVSLFNAFLLSNYKQSLKRSIFYKNSIFHTFLINLDFSIEDIKKNYKKIIKMK